MYIYSSPCLPSVEILSAIPRLSPTLSAICEPQSGVSSPHGSAVSISAGSFGPALTWGVNSLVTGPTRHGKRCSATSNSKTNLAMQLQSALGTAWTLTINELSASSASTSANSSVPMTTSISSGNNGTGLSNRAYSKSNLATTVAFLIWGRHMLLSDLAAPLIGGRQHPLFLLALQQLASLATEEAVCADEVEEALVEADGKSDQESGCIKRHRFLGHRQRLLVHMFRESGVEMDKMMPVGSHVPEKMLDVLEERDLDFLLPGLRITSELSRLLACADVPSEANVIDQSHLSSLLSSFLSRHQSQAERCSEEFITSLMSALYNRVYNQATLAGCNTAVATPSVG
ncbi:unnamed protein product [Protopolystoma xenopodis]|uniref:Uncharacterized protein n=1 Tax=Protopolystoma xenopodis TaxID=117903 RepID=A0A3S5BK94_9PLAT|nr:unnamed protein product [Protopolystoma xenopodis]